MVNSDAFSVFRDTRAVDVPGKPGVIREATKSSVVDIIRSKGTRHEAVVPQGVQYTNIPAELPNFKEKIYKFELDSFQKISICALERDESVLVAAHTSAGKTAIAEYAVSMAINRHQRIIYTSPIKALSNQKFRELQSEFKDVGLITGDVTLNPRASCIVMTTEILRNMLYKGSDVLSAVHWVVFDEIHYMRDKERGVVWEESIILLPDNVRMIFLSATIPNAVQFASWIAKTHNQVVHVVHTENRPTPLVHYVFPIGRSKMFKVKGFDEHGQASEFDRREFSSAVGLVKSKRKVADADIRELIQTLIEEDDLPTIVFSFSRKECERFAIAIDRDLLSSAEKEKISSIFENALSTLRDEDKSIPLIQNLLPLLLKGIGIHHSGLLPILRELVEILFQESLLKILFATETFSIGLNMPARSVVFTSIKKFDGDAVRMITSGEYIQMSGRAGRRGIDKSGTVIVMISEYVQPNVAADVMSGVSDKLDSAFHLSYNMVLNLIRMDGLDPVYLLDRSFFYFQRSERLVCAQRIIDDLKEICDTLNEDFGASKKEFDAYVNRNEMKVSRCAEILRVMRSVLQRGAVVDIFFLENGVIPRCICKAIVSNFTDEVVECNFLLGREIRRMSFPVGYIDRVYSARVKVRMHSFFRRYHPQRIESSYDGAIAHLEKRIAASSEFVSFDTCLLCGGQSKKCVFECEFVKALSAISNGDHTADMKERFMRRFVRGTSNRVFKQFRREFVQRAYNKMRSEYSKNLQGYQSDFCRKMLSVLKRMEYCDDKSILQKGKIACEISSGNELVITEMIFDGAFNRMAVDDMVSLLSCFVYEEWESEEVKVSKESMELFRILEQTARNVASVLNDCNIKINPDEYVRRFSYELMDVVKMWACGYTFHEICGKTVIFEGNIIRAFRRIEELLRQMSSAARVIGNVELENMFGVGISKVRRDIVFAGSLYL